MSELAYQPLSSIHQPAGLSQTRYIFQSTSAIRNATQDTVGKSNTIHL